ncbi:hypothetical protein Pmani_040272 [Petrolisthes manimaculis]|uniref:Secreted protein n=1 Tax=Petrolisthes manimaculis TaxID=1843537 RepID=A0AAE1NDM1_9EUCA|nr:hypothetical protein Pmani_040272 [Petrolisthes manimaculis]
MRSVVSPLALLVVVTLVLLLTLSTTTTTTSAAHGHSRGRRGHPHPPLQRHPGWSWQQQTTSPGRRRGGGIRLKQNQEDQSRRNNHRQTTHSQLPLDTPYLHHPQPHAHRGPSVPLGSTRGRRGYSPSVSYSLTPLSDGGVTRMPSRRRSCLCTVTLASVRPLHTITSPSVKW